MTTGEEYQTVKILEISKTSEFQVCKSLAKKSRTKYQMNKVSGNEISEY